MEIFIGVMDKNYTKDYTKLLGGRPKLDRKLAVFRDSEWAGPTQVLQAINLKSRLPDKLMAVLKSVNLGRLGDYFARSIMLTSLHISIDPPVFDLGIEYEGRDLQGEAVEISDEVDGKWLRSSNGFSSLRIRLTGDARDRYDVRYMARYRLLHCAFETRWRQNDEEVSLASLPWAQLGPRMQGPAERLERYLPIEALYVKVIPKGTPASLLTLFGSEGARKGAKEGAGKVVILQARDQK